MTGLSFPVYKIGLADPEEGILKKASEIIRQGGVVVYPADTVYSLAANALDDGAVAKIFEIKGREKGKPIHVLVKDLKMIGDLVEVSPLAQKAINHFYPGYLT